MHYNQTTEQPGGIQLFNHPSFGTIRTAGDADNPLFCLADLCKALNLNTNGVRQRLDKGVISTYPLLTKGGVQRVSFVNEDGMFDVVLESRKPEAKAFRKWVTSVVLPSIRKTGHYGAVSADPTPVSLEEFKKSLVASMQELVIKTVAETLKTYMPVPVQVQHPAPTKGEKTVSTWSLGEISKELGVDSFYLRNLLVSINVIKSSRHEVVAKTRIAQELFGNLPYWIPLAGGVERWDGILVTEKGRQEILDCLPTYKKQNPYRY